MRSKFETISVLIKTYLKSLRYKTIVTYTLNMISEVLGNIFKLGNETYFNIFAISLEIKNRSYVRQEDHTHI